MAVISKTVNFDILEKLPDGTYKKKHPETKASQVIAEDGSNLESHLAENMPHQFADAGKTYRWGFRTLNGQPQFIYEEV